MRRKTGMLAVVGMVFGLSSGALAVPMTLVNQGSTWQYSTLSTDLWSNWVAVNFSSVNWDSLAYSSGAAAFSNSGGLGVPVGTYWAANTDLALTQDFLLGGAVSGPLTLNVAADNGFAVFLNGALIAKQNAEGYTGYWEYTLPVSGAALHAGKNTIYALAEDHGGLTYFDLKLTGNVVPEPGTMLLLGSGLLGLAAVARRRTGR